MIANDDTTADAYAIVHAIRVVIGREVSPATIRSWAHRGQLERRGRDGRGRTLYGVLAAIEIARHAVVDVGLTSTDGPCNT